MLPLYDRNPVARPALVTRWLLGVNLAFFILTWISGVYGNALFLRLGFIPGQLLTDPVSEFLHVFSGMFIHASWAHVGYNMLYLWIFGDNVEDALGRFRFALFYGVCGLGAALSQFLIDPTSTLPMVGASGAIAGILGGYLVLYPRAPVGMLNPIVMVFPLALFFMPLILMVPAFLVIFIWFGVNLFNGLQVLGGAETQVAVFAHVGGFITGLITIKLFLGKRLQRQSQA